MNTTWLRTTRLSSVGFAACSAIALLLAATAPARAAFQVTLTDSRTGISDTVADGDIEDTNAAANAITISSLVVSGYTFSGSVATNNSPGGTPFNTALESSSFDVRDTATGAGGTVVGAGIASVYASANGFTAPTGPLVLGLTTGSFTNKGSSASNGTGTVESYFNPNNTVSTTAGAAGNALIGNGTTAALLPNTSQGTNDADFIALPAAYALNLALRVSFASAGGDWSNSSAVSLFGQGTQTNPVPEPASMAMWGLGLLGCMAMRMRRRNA